MSGCDCDCGSAQAEAEDAGAGPQTTTATPDELSGLRATLISDRGSVSRRGVLTGSAAAVAVLALGACSGSDEAGGTPTTGATTPDAGGSADPASGSPTGAAPTGEPIAGTNDFPVGGGVVVRTSDGVVVVTHPEDTQFLAFTGRCPHAGCPVSEVLENTIICNCHGSTFDGSTGQRLEGPAPTGLEPVPVVVEGGNVFLA